DRTSPSDRSCAADTSCGAAPRQPCGLGARPRPIGRGRTLKSNSPRAFSTPEPALPPPRRSLGPPTFDANPPEKLGSERVAVAVEQLEGDARVAAHATERRLLGEANRLAGRDDDDVDDHVLGVRVGALGVVLEDEARVEPAERDLPGEGDEGARVVR